MVAKVKSQVFVGTYGDITKMNTIGAKTLRINFINGGVIGAGDTRGYEAAYLVLEHPEFKVPIIPVGEFGTSTLLDISDFMGTNHVEFEKYINKRLK